MIFSTVQIKEDKKTFARGVHPPEQKGLARDAAIEVLPTPKKVLIPLVQHIGAPCEQKVEKGKEVALGDVVGDSESFVSAPVHASISGKTARLTVTTLPNGRHVKGVPIKAGEQPLEGKDLFNDIYGGEWSFDNLDRYEPEEIVDYARKAGLVGLGGAAFPTHVKITRNEKKPIHTLLINGCECEPYLTADYRLMVEAPEPILIGALLARHATGAEDVYVCIEDNKPEAIETMKKAAQKTQVKIAVMKTKYPQGGEKQLIAAFSGKEVPVDGLPLDIGFVVLNVGTSAALVRAVAREKPLTHRIISVSGKGIHHPGNVLVPIGASYKDLLDFCGGLKDDAARIVAGGPMMGFTLGNTDAPVTKGTSGITVMTYEECRRASETACVRCGRCVDVCPMNLVPTKLAIASRENNADILDKYTISACMECGCCAYVCPAGIPLVQLLRQGKIIASKAQEAEKEKKEKTK